MKLSQKLAIGLMSGTSLDGIDSALIETDGDAHVRPIAFYSMAYGDDERSQLGTVARLAMSVERPHFRPSISAAAEMLTGRHAEAVAALLKQAGMGASDIDVIGFHGQTIAHRPDQGWTWQIGSGETLAALTGIAVVSDFRSADVAAGGQGAPLLPVYHAALAKSLPKPLVILNLGGVANITYIPDDGELIAFDTGPANGLIDSWMEAETGARFDEGGALAVQGEINEAVLMAMLDHPFFATPPPKSLDRHDFTIQPARALSAADGAATLTAFTAAGISEAFDHLPTMPKRLLVVGGGRHNDTMLAMIAAATGLTPELTDSLGWNGDAMEAEGFAYMAVRKLLGLPISFPGTTGAPYPMEGGVLHPVPEPEKASRSWR